MTDIFRRHKTRHPDPGPPVRKHLTRRAVFAYTVLAVVFLWPLPVRPGEIIQDAPLPDDTFIFLWNAWWLLECVKEGMSNPFICDRIFSPVGVSLAYHTLSPLGTVPAAVSHAIGGDTTSLIVGFNLRFFLSFILAGWAAFRLARRWTGAGGAFLAGLLYSFSMYHLNEAPRIHVGSFEILPLILLTGLRLFDRPSLRRVAPFCLALSCGFYDTPDFFLYSCMFLVPAAVRALIIQKEHRWRLVAYGAAATAGLVILCFPLVYERLHWWKMQQPFQQVFALSPVDVVLPDHCHPIHGLWCSREVATRAWALTGFSLFWGFVPFVVILAALALRHRPPLAPVIAVLVAVFLAMGPDPGFLGVSPYGLVSKVIPLLSASRTPVRFTIVAFLFFSILTGWAWNRLPFRQAARGFLFLLAAALLLVEQCRVPLRIAPHKIAEPLRALAKMEPGLVLNIPTDSCRKDMMAQTCHRHPLMVGCVPRAHFLVKNLISWNPVLEGWFTPEEARTASRKEMARVNRDLAALGVKYVTFRNIGGLLADEVHDRILGQVVEAGFVVVQSSGRVTLFECRDGN